MGVTQNTIYFTILKVYYILKQKLNGFLSGKFIHFLSVYLN
jgi:hypothetical protein